jgi:hypothetical protein
VQRQRRILELARAATIRPTLISYVFRRLPAACNNVCNGTMNPGSSGHRICPLRGKHARSPSWRGVVAVQENGVAKLVTVLFRES